MTPQIVTQMQNMFEYAYSKKWYKTYWAFDIHKTIILPDYKRDSSKMVYYDYAKESLQILTERDDIIMFLWTNSYPKELNEYQHQFKKENIIFTYENENPEITSGGGVFGHYDKKPYFNILFEDKAGFNPETDWAPVYKYLLTAPKPKKIWKTLDIK